MQTNDKNAERVLQVLGRGVTYRAGAGGGEAGLETSSVQICGISGFDLAEFFSSVTVFILSGATFCVPGGLEGPRGPQGGTGGCERAPGRVVLGEFEKCVQLVKLLIGGKHMLKLARAISREPLVTKNV